MFYRELNNKKKDNVTKPIKWGTTSKNSERELEWERWLEPAEYKEASAVRKPLRATKR